MLPLPRFKLKGMLGFTEGPASNLGDEKKKICLFTHFIVLVLERFKTIMIHKRACVKTT